MRISLIRPLLTAAYAAAAIIVGAFFAVIVIAGFFFGTAVAFIAGAIGATTFANTAREIPRQFNSPGRDEVRAVLAALAVAAVTVPVAVFTDGFAWIGIPIGGGALIWMLYAYSHPDYRIRADTTDEGAQPAATPAADLRVGLVDTLKTVDIFEGLGEPDLRALAELGAVRTVREGDGLGDEGQVGDSVYVVLAGRAQLSANSSIGRVTARIVGPGESFPLAALLGSGRLITTARAQEEMRVWQVGRTELIAFFQDNPRIACHVYERAASVLAERYRSTVGQLGMVAGRADVGESLWVNA